jgi:prevent-host-death family protein
VFVLTTNQKGAIAETKIAAAATELGVPVLRPIVDHARYDLAFEMEGGILRVQCKWGALDEAAGVIKVNLTSSRCTPDGYERRYYEADEIDLVAVYCAPLDRCYLLSSSMVVCRRSVQLRVTSPLNGQTASVNLADDFLFPGAIAQLGGRLRGTPEVAGSSPASSTPTAIDVGCNDFPNRFGLYLERAAAGDEIRISRHGRPYARVVPAQPQLTAGWIS